MIVYIHHYIEIDCGIWFILCYLLETSFEVKKSTLHTYLQLYWYDTAHLQGTVTIKLVWDVSQSCLKCVRGMAQTMWLLWFFFFFFTATVAPFLPHPKCILDVMKTCLRYILDCFNCYVAHELNSAVKWLWYKQPKLQVQVMDFSSFTYFSNMFCVVKLRVLSLMVYWYTGFAFHQILPIIFIPS